MSQKRAEVRQFEADRTSLIARGPRIWTLDSFGRRQFFAGAAAIGLSAFLPRAARSQASNRESTWRKSVVSYLEHLARKGGGYGWDDQQRPHLTPTFAVIGCYHALGIAPPNSDLLVEFVRTHHPARLKKLEQEHRSFDYQQIQSLAWLAADVNVFREVILSWKAPRVYLKQYEEHGYPVFQQEIAAILCRPLLKLPVTELPAEYVQYLEARRRANGSYNNTPANDASDGNVLNTWWGLQALDILGRSAEKKQETATWLRACQLPNGGFTYQPNAEVGGVDDVAYTWAAVRSLALLGEEPAHRSACLGYLHSLWNDDGGFGDRSGWTSNPLATFYALDALAALDTLDANPPPPKRTPSKRPAFPDNLQVFSIQLEAHGKGSPAEAVDLASALKIHLWGAKNATPAWLSRAQAYADERKLPVKFFVSNEEYGTWVSVPGMGTYSHTSDIIAPVGVDCGESLAGAGVVPWTEYRKRRLNPLVAAQGRLVWQFGENEPLVRILLDDSLQRGGFAAISTFHFGNPDFTNSEPFLKRYRLQMPFVALQDAHGNEPWWFADMTTGFRTLFLATEPTWEGWLAALEKNWVVAVRHDEVSGNETWMHGGPSEVNEIVRANSQKWRWWDNPSIVRPLVSIVALTPADEFEAGRPTEGMAIRVRCAWENTPQGLAKSPLVEFVKLVIDGEAATPQLVARRRPNGLFDDHYHLLALPKLSAGNHTATAIVRHLATGSESERTIEFVSRV
jgi:hypothetical protein